MHAHDEGGGGDAHVHLCPRALSVVLVSCVCDLLCRANGSVFVSINFIEDTVDLRSVEVELAASIGKLFSIDFLLIWHVMVNRCLPLWEERMRKKEGLRWN